MQKIKTMTSDFFLKLKLLTGPKIGSRCQPSSTSSPGKFLFRGQTAPEKSGKGNTVHGMWVFL